jgi:hypothetical protein
MAGSVKTAFRKLNPMSCPAIWTQRHRADTKGRRLTPNSTPKGCETWVLTWGTQDVQWSFRGHDLANG